MDCGWRIGRCAAKRGPIRKLLSKICAAVGKGAETGTRREKQEHGNRSTYIAKSSVLIGGAEPEHPCCRHINRTNYVHTAVMYAAASTIHHRLIPFTTSFYKYSSHCIVRRSVFFSQCGGIHRFSHV